MNKNSLLDKLTLVEHLAKASKIKRFLKSPFHYICAIGFRDLIYPMTRKGIIQKKNTFFGMPMQIILPSSTDIYLTGGKSHDSEIRLAKFLIHNLNTGDIFVDVGAHFGYFTLLASKLVGTTGNVFAFEASKNTYEILASNTQYYNNINTYNNLITNRGGVFISFYEFPVLYSEYNAMNIEQYEKEAWFKKFNPKKIEVEAITLNDFVEKHSISVSIIKIDVEGAEDKVIEGSLQLLNTQQPFIVMEYLEPSRHNKTHRKAVELLQNSNYQAYSINKTGDLIPCNNIEQYLANQKLDSDNIVFKKML